MNITVLLAIILAASLTGACRQPDGSIPALDEDSSNRVGDLGNDLQAIARGEASAHKDLADGLAAEVEGSGERLAVVQEFAGRLADAVASAKLTEQSAQQLAHTSWTLMRATELSERQTRALQAELRSQLSAIGVSADLADAVVADVPPVQRAVTTRPRRWYEVL